MIIILNTCRGGSRKFTMEGLWNRVCLRAEMFWGHGRPFNCIPQSDLDHAQTYSHQLTSLNARKNTQEAPKYLRLKTTVYFPNWTRSTAEQSGKQIITAAWKRGIELSILCALFSISQSEDECKS